MAAPDPLKQNQFGRWMIAEGYTAEFLAGRMGCHAVTVARWRLGWRISKTYSRILRAFYPEAPLPPQAKPRH